MHYFDDTRRLSVRNPRRPHDESDPNGARLLAPVFQGWGPKLIGVALAIVAAALAMRPASANVVAVASCENHDARLVSSPALSVPEGAAAGGEAILRVDLSASGQIRDLAVAQSAGSALLDFAAMREARESHYAAAFVDCKPVAAHVLYHVTFPN